MPGPDGVSLSYTDRVADFIVDTLDNTPEVEEHAVITGVALEGAGPNRGSFFVKLKNWDERPGKEQTAEKVIEKLNRQFSLNRRCYYYCF